MPSNHALQRTRRGRRGCKRCVPCAGSLSLGLWGKNKKTMLLSFLLISALVAGCRERDKVFKTGCEGFTFNGVRVELPNSGNGQYGVTPKQLDYRWEGKTLRIHDLGDKTVSVTTPLVTDQIVGKSLIIVIDPVGNITTRTPNGIDEILKPQQEAIHNP
jgi:hypothetical protein